MSFSDRRVVVTGLGALTPIGDTVPAFWDAMMAGQSGAAPITHFDPERFATRFACELKGFDADEVVDRKDARRMDPFCHFAIAAADEALRDAGIDSGAMTEEEQNQTGVVFGSGHRRHEAVPGPGRRLRRARAAAHLAVLRADDGHRPGAGPDRDAPPVPRAQLRDRLGVRDVQQRHRRRLPAHQERARRDDGRRRHRRLDHRDRARRLRQHEGALDAQRRRPRRPAARSTSTATGS